VSVYIIYSSPPLITHVSFAFEACLDKSIPHLNCSRLSRIQRKKNSFTLVFKSNPYSIIKEQGHFSHQQSQLTSGANPLLLCIYNKDQIGSRPVQTPRDDADQLSLSCPFSGKAKNLQLQVQGSEARHT
jgi:hypothetical protein